MEKSEIKEFEKDKNVIYISEVKYLGKKYIKALKNSKKELKYIYYESANGKEVQEKEIISGLKENYEIKASNIVY